MRRLFGFVAVLTLFLAPPLAGQACLGSLAGPGQVSLAGLLVRSSSLNSYGANAAAALPGGFGVALGYAYMGDTPAGDERSLHKARGRVAYELTNGRLSVCPALGADYDVRSYALQFLDPNTQAPATVHPGWRTTTVPATLNVAYRLDAPGGVSVVPMLSAGAAYWRFDGREGALAPIDGELQRSGSTSGWVGSLGATVGWKRIFVSGAAARSTLPLSDREWAFTAGWLTR